MCNIVNHRDRAIETPRQLMGLLREPSELVWLDKRGELDWCLCVIDIPKTLDRVGLKWTRCDGTTTFVVED